MSSNKSINSQQFYFGELALQKFAQIYDPIHIPLSVVICIFGTACNAMNIIVLTRSYLRTPVNVLLTGLSIAQLALTANYIGLLAYQTLRRHCVEALWSYHGAWFMLINVNLNVIFHTTAFGHTVIVALFRFMAVKWPTHVGPHLTIANARRASLIVWLVLPLLCIPVFLTSQVSQVYDYQNCSATDIVYDLGYRNSPLLLSLVFWMFGILFKLVPSCLLTVLVGCLVHSMKQVDKKRTLLGVNVTATTRQNKRIAKPRTTRMLVCVVLLCVCVELPHGILNLLTGIYGREFGVRYYDHIGNVFEMLTLLYSSINFVLYCAMSTEFQTTFIRLFCCCKRLATYHPVPNNTSPSRLINRQEETQNVELSRIAEKTTLLGTEK